MLFRSVVGDALPTIVVRRNGVVTTLLSSHEIESVEGIPEELVRLISERLGA